MQRGFIAGILSSRYTVETAIRIAMELDDLDPIPVMTYLAQYLDMTGVELAAFGRTYAALCNASLEDVTPYLGAA